MNHRFLVYTCVIGGYDRVYPPVVKDDHIDYILITDDPKTCVSGWSVHVVDTGRFTDSRSANRYFKMLAHQEFPGFSASMYVDGNIRLLGSLEHLFSRFMASKSALGVFRHPLRTTVRSEIRACLSARKVLSGNQLEREWDSYVSDGFMDDVGLIEATILMKNHQSSEMATAMDLWWTVFQRFDTRDQISLPYVLWKTGASCMYQDFSFRQDNPYFAIYPHWKAANVPQLYTHLSARSHDSLFHRCLLGIWEFTWTVRRSWRRMRGQSPQGASR